MPSVSVAAPARLRAAARRATGNACASAQRAAAAGAAESSAFSGNASRVCAFWFSRKRILSPASALVSFARACASSSTFRHAATASSTASASLLAAHTCASVRLLGQSRDWCAAKLPAARAVRSSKSARSGARSAPVPSSFWSFCVKPFAASVKIRHAAAARRAQREGARADLDLDAFRRAFGVSSSSESASTFSASSSSSPAEPALSVCDSRGFLPRSSAPIAACARLHRPQVSASRGARRENDADGARSSRNVFVSRRICFGTFSFSADARAPRSAAAARSARAAAWSASSAAAGVKCACPSSSAPSAPLVWSLLPGSWGSRTRRSAVSSRVAVSAAAASASASPDLAALDAARTPSHANTAVSADTRSSETCKSSRARPRHGSSRANAFSRSSSTASAPRASRARKVRWSTARTRLSSSQTSRYSEVCPGTQSPPSTEENATSVASASATPIARVPVLDASDAEKLSRIITARFGSALPGKVGGFGRGTGEVATLSNSS